MDKIIVSDDAKVLVVMPRFLGDSVMATSALQMLRDIYPTQRIFLLARPAVAALFSDCSIINEEIIIDRRYSDENYSFFKFSRFLKSYKFDVVYYFRNSFSDALLCFFASIKNRVGYLKNARGFLLTHKFKLNSNYHYQYRYCNLVNAFNDFIFMPKIKLNCNKYEFKLSSKSLPNVVVYYGGSNKLERHYPFDCAKESLSILYKNKQCNFFLIGDSNEKDDNHALFIYLHGQDIPVVDLTGCLTISEMKACIGNADLIITIDSGPLHIAAALNIPYVAVVGFGTSPWSCVAPKASVGINLVSNSLNLGLSESICDISPYDVAVSAESFLKK